jgi:hypothetical protein
VVVDGSGDGEGGAGGTGGPGAQGSTTDVGQGQVASAGPGSGPDTSVGVTGPGSTGTGTGGGAPSEVCEECLDKTASIDLCEKAFVACDQSDACNQHLECLDDCDFTFDCESKCAATFLDQAFVDLVECLVCQHCSGECSGFSLAQYCPIK